MDFFSTSECHPYLLQYRNQMETEIKSFTDKEIMNCEFEEWMEYFYSKYTVTPITIFLDNTEQNFEERQIKKYNHFYRNDPYESEYYLIDGYCITFKVYFDGNSDLFELRPNSYILKRFSCAKFVKPRGENCGYFTLEYNYTKQEFESHADDLKEFVKRAFDNDIKDYLTMIGNVNSAVNSFNDSIKGQAQQMLEKRKAKASTFALLSEKLEIPMELSSNAPNIDPIPLTRINRTPPKKPNVKPKTKEYSITDGHYQNINNIIVMNGTTMEKTARTYYRNNEEELRDHLLATLNTHYDNATGETFRKIGKTDILIEFESKAAFIGECKVWHGIKQFSEAVQQLLNYSTWRDLKVSLVIFNKSNKNFHSILTAIDGWIKEYTHSHSKPSENVWKCRYYRNDMQVEIDLTVSIFDLYVDETQFKDSRKQ
ncbi:hypothetical protein GCV60_14255 [Listeria monocytogenes]|uniref:hypothetical protein n=1 Tax=Listeria monocytogenes TaxID=1639 RepID=UPI000E7271E0|nr:hypothetical protein [Listeria monocytogenes]EAD7632639.1 hypothetical protein [Listeria monocytogenes]EDH3594496.1 hypothetical protein [Listeria monocytogenes]RJZ12915.1 hypothetical protein DYZ47_02702 [Listeria monocytogenes]